MKIDNLPIKLLKKYKLLILIIALGTVLRFIGLTWGHPFIFHPDEPTLVRGGMGIRFDPNPHHFDWPHLQTYIMFFAVALWARFTDLLQALGIRPFIESIFPVWYDRPFVFYVVGRVLSATAGVLALILTYLISKKIFKVEKVALLATVILALSLQSIEDSHIATLDSSLTFWILLSFFFLLDILNKGDKKYYILSGFFAGLATSTKYNGGFLAFCIFASHISYIYLAKRNKLEIIFSKNLFLAATFMVLGFFIGTPYALFDYKTFFSNEPGVGGLWQLTRQSAPFMARYLNVELAESRIRNLAFYSTSAFIVLFYLYGLLVLFTKKKSFYALPLLVFAFGYLYYVSMFPLLLSQYFTPLYPFIAIVGAWGFFEFVSDFKLKKATTIILLFLMLLPLVAKNIGMLKVYGGEDNRIRAYKWVLSNVPPLSKVALAGADKIELPDIPDDLSGGYESTTLIKELVKVGRHESDSLKIKYLKEIGVTYVVVSDFALQEILANPIDPGFEGYSDAQWATVNLNEVARFKQRSKVEPMVIIYSVGKTVENSSIY